VRVVLGEDLTLLRDGLIRLLTAYGMEVVAAAGSGPELLAALVSHRPDVAVVDVRLPPTFTDEGLRAAIEARAQLPGLPVLVLSQHVEQLYARELLSAGSGGLGYLLNDRVSDVLRFIEAVRCSRTSTRKAPARAGACGGLSLTRPLDAARRWISGRRWRRRPRAGSRR